MYNTLIGVKLYALIVKSNIAHWPRKCELYVPYVVIGNISIQTRWLVKKKKNCFRFDAGLHEFTNYLRKEYSHENIRFWLAVNDLKRSCQSQILQRVKEIYELVYKYFLI